MEDIKIIFAKNLISLRKQSKITQAELAREINYSDKAVSKWERGDSIPDVVVLKSIADLFGVTIDYLITEHEDSEPVELQSDYEKGIKKKNRILISVLPIVGILVVATIVYVILHAVAPSKRNFIFCYILPLPICALIEMIFSGVWGKKIMRFIAVSALIWLTILDVFLVVGMFLSYYPLIFVIALPAEILVLISFGIIRIKK